MESSGWERHCKGLSWNQDMTQICGHCLHDVVSAVEDGLPLTKTPPSMRDKTRGEPSDMWHDNFLQDNSLLPVKHWDALVATLSDFSKTGWVSRWLTSKELGLGLGMEKRRFHVEHQSRSQGGAQHHGTPKMKGSSNKQQPTRNGAKKERTG